jgi:hypothetical protein
MALIPLSIIPALNILSTGKRGENKVGKLCFFAAAKGT